MLNCILFLSVFISSYSIFVRIFVNFFVFLNCFLFSRHSIFMSISLRSHFVNKICIFIYFSNAIVTWIHSTCKKFSLFILFIMPKTFFLSNILPLKSLYISLNIPESLFYFSAHCIDTSSFILFTNFPLCRRNQSLIQRALPLGYRERQFFKEITLSCSDCFSSKAHICPVS